MAGSLRILWLFLPAGAANMAPIIFKSVPFLDYPIDFSQKIGSRRILGDHKTWRGLAAGVMAGTLCAIVQGLSWQWGALLGLGALLGDLVKSFFKRRLNIDEGQSWWIADQIDWIVGALIVTQSIAMWTASDWFVLITVGAILHLAANIAGYYLNLKSNLF